MCGLLIVVGFFVIFLVGVMVYIWLLGRFWIDCFLFCILFIGFVLCLVGMVFFVFVFVVLI